MSSGKPSIGSKIETSSSAFENMRRFIIEFYNWVASFFTGDDDQEKTVFIKTKLFFVDKTAESREYQRKMTQNNFSESETE